MPDSKSGALTSLATAQQLAATRQMAHPRNAACYFQGSSLSTLGCWEARKSQCGGFAPQPSSSFGFSQRSKRKGRHRANLDAPERL